MNRKTFRSAVTTILLKQQVRENHDYRFFICSLLLDLFRRCFFDSPLICLSFLVFLLLWLLLESLPCFSGFFSSKTSNLLKRVTMEFTIYIKNPCALNGAYRQCMQKRLLKSAFDYKIFMHFRKQTKKHDDGTFPTNVCTYLLRWTNPRKWGSENFKMRPTSSARCKKHIWLKPQTSF